MITVATPGFISLKIRRARPCSLYTPYEALSYVVAVIERRNVSEWKKWKREQDTVATESFKKQRKQLDEVTTVHSADDEVIEIKIFDALRKYQSLTDTEEAEATKPSKLSHCPAISHFRRFGCRMQYQRARYKSA